MQSNRIGFRWKVVHFTLCWLPILWLLGGGWFYLRATWQTAYHALPPALSQFLTEQLKVPISVEALRIERRTLHATGIQMQSEGKPLLQLPLLQVRFFRHGVPLLLEAVEPQLWIERDRRGHWNFEVLIPPEKAPRRTPLAFRLHVRKGSVYLRDAYPRKGRPLVQTQAQVKELSLYAQDEWMWLKAGGQSSATGELNLRLLRSGPLWMVEGSASQLKWDFLRYYFPELPIEISGGRGKVQLHLMAQQGHSLLYSGDGQVEAETVRLKRRPLGWQAVKGQIAFSNAGFRLDVTGQQGGGQTTIRALLRRLEQKLHPRWLFYAEGHSHGQDAKLAWNALAKGPSPFSGSYAVAGRAWGTFDQPTVTGIAKVEHAQIAGLTFQHLNGPLLFTHHTLWLPAFQAELAGGKVYARLRYQPSQVQLYGEVHRLKLARLRQAKELDLTGELSAQVIAQGKPNRPRISLNLGVEKLAYKRTPLGILRARLESEGNRWHIPTANLMGEAGLLQATGLYDGKQFDLSLEGTELDLEWIVKLASKKPPPVEGIAYLTGQLKGTFQQPRLEGFFEVFDGRVGRVQAEAAAFEFQADRDQINLRSLQLSRRSAWLKGHGLVRKPMSESPALDLTLEAGDVSLEDLSAWFESPVKLNGLLAADLYLGGTLKNPSVQGRVRATQALVDQVPVEEAQLTLRYDQQNGWRLRSEKVLLAGGNLQLEGTVDRTRRLQFQFSADQLALKALASYLPADIQLEGQAQITGQLAGSLDQPAGRFQLQVAGLTFNHIPVGRVQGAVRLEEGVWWGEGITLEAPKGKIVMQSLRYNSEDGSLQGQGHLQGVSLAWMKQIVQERAQNIDLSIWERLANLEGDLEASWQLDGSTDQPRLALTASAHHMQWRDQALGEVLLQGRWDQNVFQIEQAHWRASETLLNVRGYVEPDGKLQLKADLNGFPLEWLRLWEPSLPEVKGRLDLSLDAEGRIESPNVRLAITASQISHPRYHLERALFSEIRVQEGAIETEDALLYHEGYVVHLSGHLPFHWSPFKIPRDEAMDVTLSLRDQSLSLLSQFVPIDPARTEGTLNAQVRVRGTLDSPEPTGFLGITQGRLAWKDFQTFLSDLSLRVRFEKGRAIVEHASAHSSAGGRVRLEEALLNVQDYPQGEVQAKVVLDNFTVEEPRLAELTGAVHGIVSGALEVSGKFKEALVQGALTVSKGSLNLPSEWKTVPRVEAPPINPRFDVAIAVAPTAELRTSNLRCALEGELNLQGNLEKPVLSGLFSLARGAMNLPTARLRIEPGSTLQLTYPVQTRLGETIARLDLNLHATTSVVLTDFTGYPQRYRIDLEIRGPLDDPSRFRLTGRSDPVGLSEQRILALLGREPALGALVSGRNPEEVLRTQLADVFTGQLLPTLLEPLETGLASAFRLEQLALEYDRLAPLSVFLVKNLFDGFGISYRRSFFTGPHGHYQVRFFYRPPLRNRFLQRLKLGWGFDDQQIQIWFVEGSFLFR